MGHRDDDDTSHWLERAPNALEDREVVRVPEQRVFLFLDDADFARAVSGWLEKRGVVSQQFDDVNAVMAAAARATPALVLVEDLGGGPPASLIESRLAGHLDRRLHDVPLVVAQSERARRPLPGSSSYQSRSYARFLRLPCAARAASNVVCTVLAQRPHVVVRPARPRRVRGETRGPVFDTKIRSGAANDGVLKAVYSTLSVATASLSAQVERVADRFEIRTTGEQEPFTLQVGWLTPRAERFVLRGEGALLDDQTDALQLVPQRGLKRRLMSMFGRELELGDAALDDALLIRASESGRAFLHATRNALLTVAPFLVEVRRDVGAFRVVLDEVPRHALEAQVNATFDLWLRAQKERFGVEGT